MSSELSFAYLHECPTHILQTFVCSDEPDLETFLKEEAVTLHFLNTAITRLYFDEQHNLIGYFTLFNDMVHIFKSQRTKFGWTLPKGYNYFPAIRLHYLGVDERFRKKGYGRYLLIEALRTCYDLSKDSGCNFITAESLKSAVSFYEKYGFKTIKRESNKYDNMVFKLSDLED